MQDEFLPMTQVVGIVVLSAVFLGERDIFTVRMVIGCAHMLDFVPCLDLAFAIHSCDAHGMMQRQSGVRRTQKPLHAEAKPKHRVCASRGCLA